MPDEIIDLIDENDNVVGEALKSKCHKEGLWHRAATVLVFNKKGELLVQKRAPNMARPNLLCASASGHLIKGDSYEQGAKRELQEELGIECEIKPIGNFIMDVNYPDGEIDKEHYALFFCNYDGEFNIKQEELAFIKFFSVEELKQMIKENPNQFTPGFRQEFKHYLGYLENI